MDFTFKKKIWKAGNSHVVSLPSGLFEANIINVGDELEITINQVKKKQEVIENGTEKEENKLSNN